jgi:hypothetical protein
MSAISELNLLLDEIAQNNWLGLGTIPKKFGEVENQV